MSGQSWPDPKGQENGLFTIDYCIQLPSPSNGHNDLRGRPAVLAMPGILYQKPESPNLGTRTCHAVQRDGPLQQVD